MYHTICCNASFLTVTNIQCRNAKTGHLNNTTGRITYHCCHILYLVSAFVGGDWRKIYDYALAHDFRFLSYGDSSLLIPKLKTI